MYNDKWEKVEPLFPKGNLTQKLIQNIESAICRSIGHNKILP